MVEGLVYRIVDWNKHFEKSRTRELKQMRWVALPNKLDGDGYTELVDHADGAAHYGAWVVLVAIASRCEPRGTLLRSGNVPHTAHSLARISRLHARLFEAVLPRLVSIGWIDTYTIPHLGTGISHRCATIQDSTVQDSTVEDKQNAAHSFPATPQAESPAPSKWIHERSPPHKHDKPDCAPCAVYRLACVAEEILREPFSPAFARAAKSLKPHMNLGLEEIERRWRAFLLASREEIFLGQNRTIPFFASRINAGFGPRPSGQDDDPDAKFRALIPK